MKRRNILLQNKIMNRAVAGLLTLALTTSLLSSAGMLWTETAQAAVSLHNPIYDSGAQEIEPGRVDAIGNIHNPVYDADADKATWDCVWFGSYWQNDTNGDGVADRNDEKEPIKWRVLSVDGDDVFLLADTNLEMMPYNTELMDATWESCTLRSWLNGYDSTKNACGTDYTTDNFIDNAFSATEQAAIKNTNVVNEDKSYYGTAEVHNTTDKIYLLSLAEATNPAYGFCDRYDSAFYTETRTALNTAYVEEQVRAYMRIIHGSSSWWLRSPGFSCNMTTMIGTDNNGSSISGASDMTRNSAVRPALHLTLSALPSLSYGGTMPSTLGGKATWDCVYFGNYWQSDTNGDGVADISDAKEPIKWRVLSVDGDDVFLLADANLDRMPYDTGGRRVTWETCTLRSWLNGYDSTKNTGGMDYTTDNFIDNAFSATEQAAIKNTDVVNEDNPYDGSSGGNNTTDKVYLLSIAEVSNPAYGFWSRYGMGSDTREALNTAYVKNISTNTDDRGRGPWWLRSSGSDGAAVIVHFDGWGFDTGWATDSSNFLIRPAIHLSLSALESLSYAGTVCSDGTVDESGSGSGSNGTPEPSKPTNVPDETKEPVKSPTPTSTTEPTVISTATPGPNETKEPVKSPAPTFKPNVHNPVYDANADKTIWDCVWFGSYWQSDTNGDGVADKKDKKELIKWRVLSVNGDDVFLLADNNLDVVPYHTERTDVTWETCTLRSWLNGYDNTKNACGTDYTDDNFIDNAFSDAEQAAIKNTDVVNEDNPQFGTSGGNNTADKIYLLSCAEASNPAYGFSGKYEIDHRTRVGVSTQYALDKGACRFSDGSGWWWLRSSGHFGSTASFVTGLGCGYYGGPYVDQWDNVVRPVLHLKVSASTALSYAGTVCSDGTVDGQGSGSGSSVTPEPSTPTKAPGKSPEPTLKPTEIPAITSAPDNTSAPTGSPMPSAVPTGKPAGTPSPTKAPDGTQGNAPVTGQVIKDTSSAAFYQIVSASAAGGTVSYVRPESKTKKVTVPATISYAGKKYKVTSIAKKAFAGNKKLKTVVIGKNVKTIGKQAFQNCKALSKVTVKSNVLTKVEKNAFKGTGKKLIVKVPRNKRVKYKKTFKGKGNTKLKVK